MRETEHALTTICLGHPAIDGVDIYFSGHVHSYTRTLPVYQSKVMQKGPSMFINPPSTMYVVAGGAGCDEMTTDGAGAKYGAEWVAKTDAHYGTGIFTVHNRTALSWSYIISDSLVEEDSFTLIKL